MSEDTPIGLPPRSSGLPTPTAQDLWMSRGLNLFGLVSPASNLGMIRWCPGDVRWFGLGAGVICGIAMWYGGDRGMPSVFWGAAALHYLLVILGLIHPLWPELAAKAWNRFGLLIGSVMVFPMFGLIYYLFVTPTALAMRLCGKDPLHRNAPPGESYWTPHEPPKKEQYERQF